MRVPSEMGYPAAEWRPPRRSGLPGRKGLPRRGTVPLRGHLPPRRNLPLRGAGRALLLAGLALGVLLGCSLQEAPVMRTSSGVSCSLYRLDAGQQLFVAARASLARHYRERSVSSLNAAYNFAADAGQMARAASRCSDFDAQARAAARNLLRMSDQLRALAFSTMRDPDAQIATTLLQEQYAEAFAGRDIE